MANPIEEVQTGQHIMAGNGVAPDAAVTGALKITVVGNFELTFKKLMAAAGIAAAILKVSLLLLSH